MKICVAQTRAAKGDFQRNINNHKGFIDLAIAGGADAIFFPELSLTGYEPKLARALAMDQDDSRLDVFQKISDANQIMIGAGAPTKSDTGTCISMIIFRPHLPRETYSKQFLFPDEEEQFVPGRSAAGLIDDSKRIALAICYEISVPEHSAKAYRNDADVYLASVAKSARGVEDAGKRLPDIAGRYSMAVLMSNCVGESDGVVCAGKTSVWNNKGSLIAQLDDASEGIIVFDTVTETSIKKTKNRDEHYPIYQPDP